MRRAHRHTDTDIQTNGTRGSLCRVSRSSQLSSHMTSSSSGNQNPTKDKNSTQSVSQSVTNRFHRHAAAAIAAPSLYGFLHHLLLPGYFSLSFSVPPCFPLFPTVSCINKLSKRPSLNNNATQSNHLSCTQIHVHVHLSLWVSFVGFFFFFLSCFCVCLCLSATREEMWFSVSCVCVCTSCS